LLKLKFNIEIETYLCIHAEVYFIFVLIPFGWNLVALKILFIKKALENRKGKQKKNKRENPSQPSFPPDLRGPAPLSPFSFSPLRPGPLLSQPSLRPSALPRGPAVRPAPLPFPFIDSLTAVTLPFFL